MERENNSQKPEDKGFIKGMFNLFKKQSSGSSSTSKSNKDTDLKPIPLESPTPRRSMLQKSRTDVKENHTEEDKKQLENQIAKKKFQNSLFIDKEIKYRLKEVLKDHKIPLVKRPSSALKPEVPLSSRYGSFLSGSATNRHIDLAQGNQEAKPEDRSPFSDLTTKSGVSMNQQSHEINALEAKKFETSQDHPESVKGLVTLPTGQFAPQKDLPATNPKKTLFLQVQTGSSNAKTKTSSLLQRVLGLASQEGNQTRKSSNEEASKATSKQKESSNLASPKAQNPPAKNDANTLILPEEPESPVKFNEYEKQFSDVGPKRRKQKMYLFFNAPHSSKSVKKERSLLYNIFILVLYIIESSLIVAETSTDLELPNDFWVRISRYFLIVYIIEYFLRIYCYNAFDETLFEFFQKTSNIVDLLAIIYTSVEIFFEIYDYNSFPDKAKVARGLIMLRWMRGFRFSVFNRGRKVWKIFCKEYLSYKILIEGLGKSKKPLSILAFFAFLLIVCFASMMFTIEATYFEEQDTSSVQTEPITTIPQSLWWAIITVTTVGYGDSIPISLGGKILGVIALLFGVMLISLPVAIMGNNFQDVYLSHKNKRTKKQRKRMEENVNDPKISNEEKEIFKIIVMLNQLEEINENIEKHLTNNKFLYRSITRDALNLISKIELSNKASNLQKFDENQQEIVANIRRSVIKKRRVYGSRYLQPGENEQ